MEIFGYIFIGIIVLYILGFIVNLFSNDKTITIEELSNNVTEWFIKMYPLRKKFPRIVISDESSDFAGTFTFTRDISSEEFNISNLDLSSLENGYIEIKLEITDPNGNLGEEPYVTYYLIENNSISYAGTSLSTDDIEANEFVIFPNPTSSFIHISFDFSTAKVFDLTGRELIKSSSQTIDLSKLTKNIYLLRTYDDSNRIIGSFKLIKK